MKKKKKKTERCSRSPSFLAFCGAAARLVTHSDHGFRPDQRLNCSPAEFFMFLLLNTSTSLRLLDWFSFWALDDRMILKKRETEKERNGDECWSCETTEMSDPASTHLSKQTRCETICRIWTLHSLNFYSVFFVWEAEHDTVNFFEIKLSSRGGGDVFPTWTFASHLIPLNGTEPLRICMDTFAFGMFGRHFQTSLKI